MQRKLLCRAERVGGTMKTPALCCPEDVNLKAGGSARLEVREQLWIPAETGRDASAVSLYLEYSQSL